MRLVQPKRLVAGDKIATVSLSWGGAGNPDILWRYQQGKEYLQRVFGLEVVEMPNTLKGAAWLYEHPEKRAEDLMQAFADHTIKGVFSCIGGNESVRMLPYIDYTVIRSNPKVFLGYSDTTVTHFICRKAGLSSFYGPSILAEFAENGGLHPYTERWVRSVLFSAEPIGKLEPPDEWTSEYLPWLEENKAKKRAYQHNTGYELLQGEGIASGPLIGGCLEVLEMLKGTELWPDPEEWKGTILFLETSEDMSVPSCVEYWLRNYASQGILRHCAGIVFAKPYGMKYYEEYKQAISKVLGEDPKLRKLPVLCNVSFGHTSPMALLPYGAMARIDCDPVCFSILDAGVV